MFHVHLGYLQAFIIQQRGIELLGCGLFPTHAAVSVVEILGRELY